MINHTSILLTALVVASACFVVTTRHENRLAFIRLQQQEEIRDQLQTEWGRLMLEKATWAIEHNIADDAGQRLGMMPPPPDQIITVQLQGVN
jgi:cell division protein FtsL